MAQIVITVIKNAVIPETNHMRLPRRLRYRVIMISAGTARIWLVAPNRGQSYKAPVQLAKASKAAEPVATKVAA